jgi:hypothetical protein
MGHADDRALPRRLELLKRTMPQLKAAIAARAR